MKTKFLLIILVLSSTLTFAQSKVADKFFENYAYQRAIELYKKAYDEGDRSEHVLTRLGDCYYNNSNPKEAEGYYKEAMSKDLSKIKPESFYRYSQVLLSIDAENNFEEAEKWLKLYNANRSIEKIETQKPQYYTVTNLDININFIDVQRAGTIPSIIGKWVSEQMGFSADIWSENKYDVHC